VNIATVVSMTAFCGGLLQAAVSLIVSKARGARGLRVFAVSCLLGALYAASMAMISGSSHDLSRLGARVGLLWAGLHGVSWYVYTARRDGRALFRWERWIIAVGVVVAISSLVPNLLYRTDEVWLHGVPALGIEYHDTRATPLGSLTFVFYGVAMGVLLVRALRRVPKAGWSERMEAIGLALLVAAGVNDSLVASDVLTAPYLLDVGFLSLVMLTGAGLALRFVDSARVLATTQEELLARERLAALGEMAAVIAHEVRNPVAIIFNAAASLRKMPEERDTLLAIIEEEAERLKRMASDLLDFARPTNTRMVDSPLEPIVESALGALRAGGAGAPEVEVEGELPRVHADVALLRQAILNLVANALQAPGRRGHVRVRAKAQGERVHIEVVDDGEGVPEELRSSISRPFFTTRPTGTGLGLAIVRRIAEAHDGELVLRETPGGGATFAVDVPRDLGRSVPPGASGAAGEPGDGRARESAA
jgi:two-component system sensor histidine kinase HydH